MEKTIETFMRGLAFPVVCFFALLEMGELILTCSSGIRTLDPNFFDSKDKRNVNKHHDEMKTVPNLVLFCETLFFTPFLLFRNPFKSNIHYTFYHVPFPWICF